jgi:hypothetical protein
MSENEWVEAWRNIIRGAEKSWVLFAHGTCVILMEPKGDLSAQATELMKEYGPVCVGTSSGDFSVIDLVKDQGWAVSCHHNDILTLVLPREMARGAPEIAIGMYGRSKREQDASELRVIHVEDKRVS